MKLNKAYNKDLFVRYSAMLLGAIAATTLFATGNITLDVSHITGTAIIVIAAALIAGRVIYEALKPSTAMARMEHDGFVAAQQSQQ
ncbi:hypothetical protein [Wolbachia endosymbiont of Ctenocephalides felis wCfeT]|uniref:hypothetical protein n=1 Tax=Wolbachia endosymbiont of Ctenocephalides felis wCfeT TaxID=2732593 RepID=UPI0014486E57|nr:hypothetical protein [Wolbachia endosymbiont of Ctenocephalides felis wCfeT]